MAVQHVSILLAAQSGTGKTFLANYLAMKSKLPYKIIIDYNHEYETPGFWKLYITPKNYTERLQNFEEYLKQYRQLIVRAFFDDEDLKKIVNFISQELFRIKNVFVVFDEAHEYIPHHNPPKWAVRVATMGRKFGISSLFITQRPYKLNPTVRSQTNFKIVGKMTDPRDIDAVKEFLANYKYVPYLPEFTFIYRNKYAKEYIFTTKGIILPHAG